LNDARSKLLERLYVNLSPFIIRVFFFIVKYYLVIKIYAKYVVMCVVML